MTNRWQGAPQAIRIIALAIVVVLTYGTAVHVVQLVASGFNPYQGMPGWLRTYFIVLTVLDPLAALLVARRPVATAAVWLWPWWCSSPTPRPTASPTTLSTLPSA